MARYRSSPTCSNCWTTGHTKRSCPKMKERAAKWYSENEHLKGTDKYPYKPYYVQEVEGYANIVKNRVCSWCEEGGHNKRTCPSKKEVFNKNIAKNKEWRRQILDKMREVGLGIGTLLSSKGRYDTEPTLWLVRGMDWDLLNLRASGQAVDYSDYCKGSYQSGQTYPQFIQALRVRDNQEGRLYPPDFKDKNGKALFYHGNDSHTIASGSQPEPPSEWIDDESWAKKLF
jgi:hypothetical protein